MIVAILNRWASLQHISVGLARACGWALANGRTGRAPWGLQYPELVIHYAAIDARRRVPRRENGICYARDDVRDAELRYAIACAEAGAVPGGRR